MWGYGTLLKVNRPVLPLTQIHLRETSYYRGTKPITNTLLNAQQATPHSLHLLRARTSSTYPLSSSEPLILTTDS